MSSNLYALLLPPKGNQESKKEECEMIEISQGFAVDIGNEEIWRMDNWGLIEGLKGLDAAQNFIDSETRHEIVNVLWVTWVKELAYRKGLSRIKKKF
jgi:hypothetical protein